MKKTGLEANTKEKPRHKPRVSGHKLPIASNILEALPQRTKAFTVPRQTKKTNFTPNFQTLKMS